MNKPAVSERKYDVAVVGGANSDYLVRGSSLPAPGQTVEGRQFLAAVGGKGANQAVGAARLGARCVFVGRVGDDERGDEVMSTLEAEGVEVEHLARDEDAETGVALIMVDDRGEKQILTAPGANRELSVGDVDRAARAIASAAILLVQLEVPVETVLAAMRVAQQAGVRVVLDAAPPRPLSEELLALVDVLHANGAEAEALTGMPVRDRESARSAAKALLARGVRAVAVQAGEEGNLLLWEGGERMLPKVPVKAVDATGSGDAFVAALGVAMSEGLTLTEAGPFASAAAAYKSTVLGAQAGLPRRKDLLELLAKMEAGSGAEMPASML